MVDSLWGDEFSLPDQKEKTKKIIKKTTSEPKEVKVTVEKQVKSKKIDLGERLALIKTEVLRVLGKQKENTICIRDRKSFSSYIDAAIKNGRIDIDTETNNSLDPITCKLMGPCIYTPGQKNVYIPLHHRDPVTKIELENQLTEKDVREEFQRLIDYNVKIIMHNGKFDYKVIKCTCDIELPLYWDTMIAAKLLDENEFSAGLKQQYISKIDPEQEKYDIENLFEGVEYADVEPEIFALYAATDAFMTDKLFEYQYSILSRPDYERLYNLLKNVEVPCVLSTAEMELNGVGLDMDYAKRLQDKYHKKLTKLDSEVVEFLEGLKPVVDQWRLSSEATDKQWRKQTEKQRANALKGSGYNPAEWKFENNVWYKIGKCKSDQLDLVLTPDSLGSPVQLGIILYDILGCPVVNQEKPTATGEDELKKLSKYSPLCKLMLKRRELCKLLNAFIDTLPEEANPKDGRIHGNFNQYGAATGRFSSSEPNLQQIPSHNKEIRMLFRAKPGYILVGSDFSQQEPRLLSQFSQDKNMIQAYRDGKDLYATIAMGVYHNKYEDNLEHYPDGTLNAEGKKRRGNCKSLLLGIMYGRGVASIAEQIKGTVEEAQEIVDNFYKSFPDVKKWMDESESFAKEHGYVEDLWGRRRRLPDILLPQYTVRYKDKNQGETLFNPFLECEDRKKENDKIITQYLEKALNCKGKKQLDNLKADALKNGIEIINNGGFISTAQRQCVNARIQGSAATMTKMAMNKIRNDKELKELGFRMLIGVHDELIGECPVENADRVAELLTFDMKTCAQDTVTDVPFKCDADLSFNWYFNDYMSVVKQEYNDLLAGNEKDGIEPVDEETAFKKICENHEELTLDNLKEVIFRDFNAKESDWEEMLETLIV